MTVSEVKVPIRQYEEFRERRPGPLPVRLLFTLRHLFGLALGSAWAHLRQRREMGKPRKWRFGLLRIALIPFLLFMDRDLMRQPVGVQFRRRLERMGPTYIKLGQILSLRDDLLPESITNELKKLLDTLPAMPYDRFVELVESNLESRWNKAFARIQEVPIGSASLAQAHVALLNNGDEVVIKLLKPGTREFIRTDSRIIRGLGAVLQLVKPRIQPRAMFAEFCTYTLKEVDFRLEAKNTEEFIRNFSKYDSVKFPRIYHDISNSDMLVMEYIKGMKPDEKTAAILTAEQRAKVVDIGAFAIIKMLYDDGFFHADLHPANLLIINEDQCAFIDLGMVGRFSEVTRKNMLYYYNALVLGNPESAARYLTMVARPGKHADVQGFRQAFAHVADRWVKHPNFKEFSLARLIMDSVKLAAKYDIYFPIEMVLMVKAMVTFEGVGNVIDPDLDVAEISRKHMRTMLIREVKPRELLKASLQNAPEFLDAVTRAPGLFVEVFNHVERQLTQKKPEKLKGMKGVVLGGFCLLAASVVYGMEGASYVYIPLGVIALVVLWKS